MYQFPQSPSRPLSDAAVTARADLDAMRARRDRDNLSVFVEVETKRRRSPQTQSFPRLATPEDIMTTHQITTLNHPTRGPIKISALARMWDGIDIRLKANEYHQENLDDLILKLSARRDKLRIEHDLLISMI